MRKQVVKVFTESKCSKSNFAWSGEGEHYRPRKDAPPAAKRLSHLPCSFNSRPLRECRPAETEAKKGVHYNSASTRLSFSSDDSSVDQKGTVARRHTTGAIPMTFMAFSEMQILEYSPTLKFPSQLACRSIETSSCSMLLNCFTAPVE
jgi:hypothetical protein